MKTLDKPIVLLPGEEGQTNLSRYIKDAGEVPLLTPEEEIHLAGRIKTGDEKAREHFILANLRLVIKIARDYSNYGLSLLDLINEGNIGLMKGVDRFDPTKGAKFSTYGAWWIKQSIKRALSNQAKNIRVPIHLAQDISRMRKIENYFEAKHGKPPTDIEIAALMEEEVEKIDYFRGVNEVGTISLDTPLGSDPDAGVISDLIPDQSALPWDDLENETIKEIILSVVDTLKDREKEIIVLRFGLAGGDPKTLDEIGLRFGLTRERIRQIEAMTLAKMRDRFESRDNPRLKPEQYWRKPRLKYKKYSRFQR